MRKTAERFIVIFSAMLLALPGHSQERRNADARATVNLEALARQPESHTAQNPALRERPRPERFRARSSARAAAPPSSVLRAPAAGAATAIYGGFLGLLDNFTAVPPDTEGAVGPKHVVTMLNSQVLVQSRTGAAQGSFPISLNSFWSGLGTFTDAFDPRIVYDSAADRWIASSAVGAMSASSALLVGVSQTGDPGGNWNLYKVDIGSAGAWGDYPVLGFNGNWVVVSINLFRRSGGNYQSTDLYAFNKANLYGNGPGQYVKFSDTFGEFIPAVDFDKQPNTLYFVQAFAGDVGLNEGAGTLRISKLTGPLGSETFRGGNGGTILINDPWSDAGANGADFAPQPGTTTKIDTGDARLQNCVLRGGTIWCTHTIFLPLGNPTRAAVQWFQIDPTATKVVQRGRIDDPSATYFYAYPSIAVNRNNDALIGYTRFSADDYASAEFSFRTAADPAGTLQPDILFKHGEATYISIGTQSGSNRWGDFSTTWVDPADDLTFWTIQEYASTPPPNRRGRFGTWWAQVAAPSAGLNCTYSLSATSQAFSAAGGTGTVSVTAGSGCLWMAASNVPWLTNNSGSPGSGSGSFTYFAAPATDPSTGRGGTITIAGRTFTVTEGNFSQEPTLPAQGVVNAASYQGGGVAPGEVVTLFGTSFGPATLQQPAVSASGVVGTAAGGTRVLFDGVPAPMIYAVGGQASAVVPFAVQGHTSTQVQVEYLGTPSSASTIPVVASVPGIFTLDASGKGPGATLNQDFTVNSATNRAARGTFIVVYATGGGAMRQAVAEGTLAQPPYIQVSGAYSARIGGVAAEVLYAGEAAGIIVGVLQLNIVVPQGAPSGAAVPLDITIGGAASPAGVTVAVE